MSNFIYNNTALEAAKSDLNPLPVGADPTKWVDAVDWNLHRQALLDTQTVLRAGFNAYNVLNFGADPTGVADSTAAIQSCLDAAQAAALTTINNLNLRPTVYFPRGYYNISKPIFMGGAGVYLVGDGPSSSFIGSVFPGTFYFGPGILASQNPVVSGAGVLPAYVTSLLTGSGNAWDMSANLYFFPLDWIGTPRTLNGQSGFTAEMTLKLTANQVNNRGNLISSGSTTQIGTNPGVNDVINTAFQLWVGGSAILQQNHIIGALTINGVFQQVISSGALTLNTNHHVALTYDGTNIKLWIDGNLDQTLNAPGTITQSPFESVTLGASYQIFPAGSSGINWPAAFATVDGIRVSNVARYTANFTPPSSKPVADNNDFLVLNFVQVNLGNYQNGTWVQGTSARPGAGVAATTCYLYPMVTGASGNFSGCGFFNLGTSGIYMQGCENAQGWNLDLSTSQGWGLWNSSNGFQSNFHTIFTAANVSQGACGGIFTNFGPNSYRNHYHTGGGAAFAGWGFELDNTFYNSSTTLVLGTGTGPQSISSSTGVIRRMQITDEGNANNSTPVKILYSRVRFYDCTFEHVQAAGPQLIQISGPSNDLQFWNCEWNAHTGMAACISQSGATAPYNVIIANPIRWTSGDPTVPLTNDANLIPIDPINMSGLRGLSGVFGTSAANLRGQLTVTGAAITGTVTFGAAEASAAYQISFTPVSSTGTPAAGSNRPLSVTKNAGSAVLTVEAAPGVGNSVTFDWVLIR